MISTQKSYVQPKLIALPVYQRHKKLSLNGEVKIGTQLDKDGKVYSTVSGQVVQFVNQIDDNNELVEHVVIKNNTKNQVEPLFKDLSIKAIIDNYFQVTLPLEKLGILFDEIVLLDLVFFDEPFATVDSRFLEEQYESIIETLEKLYEIYTFKKCVILLKDDAFEKWGNTTTFPLEIKRIKPGKKINFRHLAINDYFNQALINRNSYNYLGYESILKLGEIIDYHRPSVLNHLVVHGDAIHTPTIFHVRVGTLFSDLKRIFNGYTTDKPLTIHKNYRLNNHVLNSDTFSISANIIGLFIQEHREREVYDCISCGRCNSKCPVGILPSKIMHAVEHDIYLGRMRTDLCIDCGLCSYYCPSKIPVMAFVKKARSLLEGDK